MVLQVPGAPDVAQRNVAGQSIEDLAEAFMVQAEQQARYGIAFASMRVGHVLRPGNGSHLVTAGQAL